MAPAGSWVARGRLKWVLAGAGRGVGRVCTVKTHLVSGTNRMLWRRAAVIAGNSTPRTAANRRGTRSTGAGTDAGHLHWGSRGLVVDMEGF